MRQNNQGKVKIILITKDSEIYSIFSLQEGIEIVGQFESLSSPFLTDLRKKAHFIVCDRGTIHPIAEETLKQYTREMNSEKVIILSEDKGRERIKEIHDNAEESGSLPKVFYKPWNYVEIINYICSPIRNHEVECSDQGRVDCTGKSSLESLREYARAYDIEKREAEIVDRIQKRKVITVINPKGGVGKTFFSVNLACHLAKNHSLNTALFDASLGSGDLSVQLNMTKALTISDLIPDLKIITSKNIGDRLPVYPKIPLHVLLGPDSPELCELITNEHLLHFMKVMREYFDILVIDTMSHSYNTLNFDILENSDIVVVITSSELTSLQQARIQLKLMKRLRIDDKSKVKIVLNKLSPGDSLLPEKIEQFLEKKIDAVIPEDPAVINQSILNGKPIIMEPKKVPIKNEMESAFNNLFDFESNQGKTRSFGSKSILDSIRGYFLERKGNNER